MYYPYLRGRQYELIALRELAEKEIANNNIIPIVEPVKASPTLLSFIESYIRRQKQFGIVQNPVYGSFIDDIDQDRDYRAKYISFFDNELFTPVYLFDKHIESTVPFALNQKSIAVCQDADVVNSISSLSNRYNADSFLIPDERIFKRSIHGNRILISDNFKKKQKNTSYADSIDEFFSDDHIYFAEEGYRGFSDYSIIGDDYSESGFAPYAVVIHMVYLDKDDNNALRIHHFVSESNDDYNDPAGKFAEALEKLVHHPLFKNCDTYAYKEFKNFFERGIYSGLGVVKKLSLMHHFEIISKFLENKD